MTQNMDKKVMSLMNALGAIPSDESCILAQEKIKEFFAIGDINQREMVKNANIKIKIGIVVALKESQDSNNDWFVKNNDDGNYTIDSFNIETVVDGCRKYLDILDNNRSKAILLLNIIYPEAKGIIANNPDIMIESLKEAINSFMVEHLTKLIIDSKNENIINYFKKEVIPAVMSYASQKDTISSVYGLLVLGTIKYDK